MTKPKRRNPGRPKLFTKRFGFLLRVPVGLAKRVQTLARASGIPANAWLVLAVEEAVEAAEKKRRGEGPTVRRDPPRRVIKGDEP